MNQVTQQIKEVVEKNPYSLLTALYLSSDPNSKEVLTGIKGYIDFVLKTHKRTITDSSVRYMIKNGAIDGVYSKDSSDLKYIVVMSDKTKNYLPRQYKKASYD